jgi:hypothetical protein
VNAGISCRRPSAGTNFPEPDIAARLQTTLKRLTINAKEEPHADPEKYQLLHVIIGDAWAR